MRPDQALFRNTLRGRIGRAFLAVGTVSAVAVCSVHGASLASSAPAPQPPAAEVNAAAIEARKQAISRDANRITPQQLAQTRSNSMSATAKQVAARQQAAAVKARNSALSSAAKSIVTRSKALADKSNFMMPTAGPFSGRFGPRLHPILGYYKLHNGDDIGGACGQPIWAAADGTVIKAATGGYNGGSGNNVRIDHGKIGGKDVESAYLHMTSVSVREGQKVTKGQQIGTVGSTGLSTACHLHFSVYEGATAVAPKKFLNK